MLIKDATCFLFNVNPARKTLTTCSDECKDIVLLPEEEQKALRKGKHVSNKVFRKGRSENIMKFKKISITFLLFTRKLQSELFLFHQDVQFTF